LTSLVIDDSVKGSYKHNAIDVMTENEREQEEENARLEAYREQ